MREGLSVFREVYDFYADDLTIVRDLPSGVLVELETARDAMFMVESCIKAEPDLTIYMSDASMKGFALLERQVSVTEFAEVSSHLERSRSRRVEASAAVNDDGCRGTLAGPAAADDHWDQLLVRPRYKTRALPRQREDMESGCLLPPLPDILVDPKEWKPVIVGAWRNRSKIHLY